MFLDSVSDSIVLLLMPLNLLASSFSVEGSTRIQGRKEGKRQRYLSTQNFISGFNDFSVGGKFFLKPVEIVTSLRPVFKTLRIIFSGGEFMKLKFVTWSEGVFIRGRS